MIAAQLALQEFLGFGEAASSRNRSTWAGQQATRLLYFKGDARGLRHLASTRLQKKKIRCSESKCIPKRTWVGGQMVAMFGSFHCYFPLA